MKLRFWDNSEICLLYSRKQQQMIYHIVVVYEYHIRNQRTRITPVDLLKAIFYDYFGIICIFCLLYSSYNATMNLHMTNSKVNLVIM